MISPTYLQEAHRAIECALTREPGLTRNGFPTDGQVEYPLDPRCVATALAFLDLGPVRILHTARSNSGLSSYELKHVAERWGKLLGWEPYVANGDMIAALIYRQIPIRRNTGHSPNCATGARVNDEGLRAADAVSRLC